MAADAKARIEAEVARMRLAVLEAFWAGAGLKPRERRARVDQVLQESAGHVDATIRDAVVERVLDDLARWAPAAEAAPKGGGGEALYDALAACLERRPIADAAALSPEEQRLADCVAAMVEHLTLESQQHIMFLKEVARQQTTRIPNEFLQVLHGAVKGDPRRPPEQQAEGIRAVLRDLLMGRNLLFAGARAAAAQALRKLVGDLDPERAAQAGRGGGRKSWEDYERLYEEIASLSPDELRDRYFTELYKQEIRKVNP